MDLFRVLHKRKIIITNKNGEGQKISIKRFIPMQYNRYGEWQDPHDVEVLLCEKKNSYFSISMFLKGESWVSSIIVTNEDDELIKNNIPISMDRLECLTIKQMGIVEDFILKMMNKKGSPVENV